MADKKEAAATKAASKPPVKAGGKAAAPKAPKSAGPKDPKAAKKRSRKTVRKDGTVVARRRGKDRSRINRKQRKDQIEARAAAKKRPAGDAKDGDAPAAKKSRRVRRPHRFLISGAVKFSRPRKYHRRGSWKFVPKSVKKTTPKKPRLVKKEIGGDKNGGFRMVLLKKRRQSYPTCDPIRKRRCRGVFKKHKRYIRSSLKPGTICILLAGRHRGKHVVLMKVLSSGLLLVNGPLVLNGCPLRRVSQNFVIATHTRLDLSDSRIPKHLTDDYFKRIRAAKKAKKEGDDIFTSKKEKYVPSEQRKADQKEMDKAVLKAISKFGKMQKRKSAMMIRYLKSMFGLRRNQKPHVMKF